MYEHYCKRLENERIFLAAIHGIDLSQSSGEVSKKDVEEGMLFGDPKDYEKMPEEKRKELTKRMMGRFKGMAVGGPNVSR